MTAFFTLCWRNFRPRIAALLGCAWLACVWLPATGADGPAAEVTQMRLERSVEGLQLYATVRVELPAAVEEALLRGVPMVFLAEADVVRHRWYWTDRKVASAQRHMRLAYQPLTRRWRLNIGTGVITASSLGMTLNQNFDTLAEAVAALQRVSGWKIADASMLDPDATHKVEFRFGLDLGQLPRPFQIGAFGQSDWSISATANQQIGPETTR
ncbi:MAG: DUF4390 domain-containing protein [Rhodoferax sp.]|nr:DUF4390 domain-containing protein [Rhodoferax sp.]